MDSQFGNFALRPARSEQTLGQGMRSHVIGPCSVGELLVCFDALTSHVDSAIELTDTLTLPKI